MREIWGNFKTSSHKPLARMHALIFGLEHHQVKEIQFCSNEVPGVTNVPIPGERIFI